MVEAAVNIRAWKLDREREEERSKERKRRREEIERKRQEEEVRIKALEDDAANWHKSKQIREYIAAVKGDAINRHGEIEKGSDLDRWLVWAGQHADHTDPLTESPPLMLDKEC